MKKLLGLLTFLALLFGAAVALVIAIRTYDIQRAPALSIWHTHVPHDLRADEIAKLDWDGYLLAEQRVQLATGERLRLNPARDNTDGFFAVALTRT